MKRSLGLFIVLSLFTLGFTAQAQSNRPTCNGVPATLWVGSGGNGGTIFQEVDGTIQNLGDYFSNSLGGNRPLEGSAGNDVIVGSSNNDTINGGPGDDLLCGGNAQDTIDGGEGNDQIFAGDGDDQLFGGPGNDSLFGERANDFLNGGPGDDLLNGGDNIDTCDVTGDFNNTTTNCETTTPGTLVDVAVSNNFNLLVEAVIAAGLADTLANGGPFTVFAPTDQAFVDLLNALGISKDELFANTELLTTVLLYHVLPAPAPASVVLTLDGVAVATVQGEAVTVETTPLSLIDGTDVPATVLLTDVFASNGVVHVIDKVLLPPSVVAALSS